MSKQLKTSLDARNSMKKGMDTLADIVKVTLGPKGRSVVIEKNFGEADIIQDGVNVARSIDLKNRFENMGASLLKSASIKTNDEAGDGTTGAIVLAQEIVEQGMKYTELGVNALAMRKGMKKAVKYITEELKDLSIEIKDKKQMEEIATISSKDEKIGTIVADAMDKVGKTGVVNTEKSQTNEIVSEIVEGFRFDNGYISPYMTTDKAKGVGEIEDAVILITDKAVTDIQTIMPLLEKLGQAGKKELVTICGDMGGDALATLVVNNVRGSWKSLVIKAPEFGARQKDSLEDIAILTGGTVVTKDIGLELKDVEISHLGKARKVSSTKNNTTIIEGGGDKDKIKERIIELEKQVEEEKTDFVKEQIRERLGRLSGVVAVIKIGANSEVEQTELELRVEDAISATQSALEEGIVVGGGLALIRARESVWNKDQEPFKSEDEEKGYKIIINAITKPFEQILLNAGEKPDVIRERIRSNKEKGFDASTGKYVDMVAEGIIDPTKVVRCALENASSIAEMFLSTEAIVCFEDELEKAPNIA